MSDELARLRADLEVLERCSLEHGGMASCKASIQAKIARLEAEQADPWREARGWVSSWRGQGDYPVVVSYVDHLTAENDRFAARVAELEADLQNFIDSVVFIDPSVYPQSLQQARAAMAGAKPCRLKGNDK